MMPKRIQRKRTKGWRMPEGAVYVGRPTKWGNPWKVGPELDAAGAVYLYAHDMKHNYGVMADGQHHVVTEQMAALELRGKDLACWCPLDNPCHADVLLELANQ